MLAARTGRVAKDLAATQEATLHGFQLTSPPEDLDAPHTIQFAGPDGSPYVGQTLVLQISFPPRYRRVVPPPHAQPDISRR